MGARWIERVRNEEQKRGTDGIKFFNWDQKKTEAATADLWWRMQRGTRRDGGRRIRQGERLPVKARVAFSQRPHQSVLVCCTRDHFTSVQLNKNE